MELLADNSMLLSAALPALYGELFQLLQLANEPQLAAQLPALRIVDRCRCGDDFCASFYTLPKPKGAYPPGIRTVDLDADQRNDHLGRLK